MIFNNLYDKNENDNNGKNGNTESVVKLIETRDDLNENDNNGKNGNTESVVKLIETRNDLNENDNNGKTALMLAAKNGNTENINIIKIFFYTDILIIFKIFFIIFRKFIFFI